MSCRFQPQIYGLAFKFLALRWRCFLGVLIAVNGLPILHYVLWNYASLEIGLSLNRQYLSVAVSIFALVTGVTAVVLDHKEKVKHGWLHWIGLTIYALWYIVLPAFLTLLGRFFSMEQLFG